MFQLHNAYPILQQPEQRKFSTGVPVYHGDFYSDDFILNSTQVYVDLCALGHVVWMEQQNAYAVTWYNELVHVLRNPTTFISGNGISMIDDVNALLKVSTVNSVGDEQKSCRRVTTRPLMPKEIKQLNNISTKRVKHWGIVWWTNWHLIP